ncbi:MAG: GAF domain-containing protein [Pedobacter sp.]|uniref:GAF domain-containing protein n=1 Tax=Pedobacter sp. TaxID=1411316 RepID=UPI0033988EE0
MIRYDAERLADVGRFLNLNISKEKELQEIVDFAAEICGSQIAMVTLMDGEKQYVKFIKGASIDLVDYEDTLCQYTLDQNDLLIIEDTIKDSRLVENPFVKAGPYLRFYAGVPLVSEKGNSIGTLCVFDVESHSLSELQQTMLTSLSEQVTRLLEFDLTLQILKEQYEESTEKASILLTYFQSSSSCHLLMDKNMQLITYNQALADFMFANYQTQITEGINLVDYIQPSFREEFIDYFNKALAGEFITIERHLTYAQGTVCWSMSYEQALDTSGECFGVSFNATDITRSISNQTHLNQQVDAISKINAIQADELTVHIDQISQEAKKISGLTKTLHIDEFLLLQLAVDELLEKNEKIIQKKINESATKIF